MILTFFSSHLSIRLRNYISPYLYGLPRLQVPKKISSTLFLKKRNTSYENLKKKPLPDRPPNLSPKFRTLADILYKKVRHSLFYGDSFFNLSIFIMTQLVSKIEPVSHSNKPWKQKEKIFFHKKILFFHRKIVIPLIRFAKKSDKVGQNRHFVKSCFQNFFSVWWFSKLTWKFFNPFGRFARRNREA